jgi:hypothetical protein
MEGTIEMGEIIIGSLETKEMIGGIDQGHQKDSRGGMRNLERLSEIKNKLTKK